MSSIGIFPHNLRPRCSHIWGVGAGHSRLVSVAARHAPSMPRSPAESKRGSVKFQTDPPQEFFNSHLCPFCRRFSQITFFGNFRAVGVAPEFDPVEAIGSTAARANPQRPRATVEAGTANRWLNCRHRRMHRNSETPQSRNSEMANLCRACRIHRPPEIGRPPLPCNTGSEFRPAGPLRVRKRDANLGDFKHFLTTY
jgi:hypothetical protein